jgi:hypothetical protein
MQGSATVTMSAPADKIWNLIADVRNTGRFTSLFSALGGQLRQRRNVRDMRTTLERIKAVVEAPEGA